MATKKETKAPTPTPENSAAPKAETGLNDRFVRVFDGNVARPASKKVAPQAALIINTIEAAGKSGLTRTELIKNLTGILVTRQPVGRIVSYYQKLIQEVGCVTIEKSA